MKKKIAVTVLKVILVWLLLNAIGYVWFAVTNKEKVLDLNFEKQVSLSGTEEATQSVWDVDVKRSGDYHITAKWEADSEQMLIGFKLVDAEGEVLSYCTGVGVYAEMHPIYLEEGDYKLILEYMADAAQIEAFFEGTDNTEKWYTDWEECTTSPNVKLEFCMFTRGLTEFQSGYFLGTFLIGAIVIILAVLVLGLDKNDGEELSAKKSYGAVGLAVATFCAVVVALQFCYQDVLTGMFGKEIINTSWYNWLQIIIPTYVVGFTVMLLLCRGKNTETIEKHKMSIGQFVCCICMNAAICGVGAIIGTIVNMLILVPFGVGNTSALAEMMTNSSAFWRILTVGIGAPIFEELIFRKLLIDRIHKYGEGIAIVMSGLLFGLFHGNFSQLFFATGLGFFFAYIYIRTGKVWYTIAFHMIINMSSAAISIPIMESLDMEAINRIATMDPMAAETQALTMQILPGMLLLLGWFAVLGIVALAGIVLWIVMAKKFHLVKSSEHVETKKIRTAFGNFGIIYFLVFCIFLFVQYYAGMIML